MMNNPYTRYYLEQQGRGMTVFRGSPWQMGHGQKGYGLGGMFATIARTVMPLVKRGARALGNILLNTGVNFASDVVAGKNVKQAAKARALEGANTAKTKAEVCSNRTRTKTVKKFNSKEKGIRFGKKAFVKQAFDKQAFGQKKESIKNQTQS